ncbi:MAG: hypothetical protein ACTSWQ_00355 [Candidatus Thorarchaeota archaeon]
MIYIQTLYGNSRTFRNNGTISVEITMYDAQIWKTKVTDRLQLLEFNIPARQVLTGSVVRMIASLGGTALLVYVVSLLPGLFLVVLPGMIALVGKAYDEAKLIQFLRYGNPIRTEHWENTEACTERIRIRSSKNRGISMTF